MVNDEETIYYVATCEAREVTWDVGGTVAERFWPRRR